MEAIKKLLFLILNNKRAFNHLRQAFIKALILSHLHLESYIWIKINVLTFTINRVLN